MTKKLMIAANCAIFSRDLPLPDISRMWAGGILSEPKLLADHEGRFSRGGRVLILEANGRLRLSRTRTLSREDYHVTSVSNVEEAVEAARRQPYELFIISVEEPELLNMVLAQFPPEMSVLIIATQDMISQVTECSGTGIHSFLIQPFSLSRFRDSVAQTIDRACLVKEGLRSNILAGLEQANRLLAAQSETDQFFKLVVEISAAGTKADHVSLSMKDETTEKFVIKAQSGDHKLAWQKICQQVMKMGEPVLLDETTQNHSRIHKLMTESGISAVLCIPLVIKGDMIGAINHIKTAKTARFTSSDLSFASILGWWSSIALENAGLLSTLERQCLHVERLLHEVTCAQENERRRVGIEIHDSVAQLLVGVSYDIKVCGALISESKFADLELELARIGKTVQRSIKELRRAIANLRPVPLQEMGLVGALRQAAEVLNEGGIRCRTKVDGELPKLTFSQESTTYWIVQEALTNIRNHAKASDVSLHIRYSGNAVAVEVRDNGQGFNPHQVMDSVIPIGHMGLLGMKERAELLGGYLNVESNPGKGTSIGFTFPVSSRVAMETKV